MPILFKNPNLSDYFVERDDVALGNVLVPITEDYEAGKVVIFPKLKLDIDFEFWANLPTDAYPGLKKLTSLAFAPGAGEDVLLERNLVNAKAPPEVEKAVRNQIRALYDQIVPTYEAIFGDYSFKRRQAVWRLNSTYNENLHVDTYLEEYEDHFARLFINLDNQPRIWQTSFTIEEMFEKFNDRIDRRIFDTGTRAEIWIALNKVVFGGLSRMWWDCQPRHVAYFSPGDVWAVDSRQVAHQIFYGRRAVSVDFFVDTTSMKNPKKQYLGIIDDFKQRRLCLNKA
jgi:hypothetical protein